MANLLRFKDVLKMEGLGPLDKPKKLSFDDMHTTNYRPGEDELVNYRAYRRKRSIGVSEGGPVNESADVDEALTVTQRLARKKQMKRIAPKLKLGRQRAARRIAGKEKLQKRSVKKARSMLFKKLTKDVPKGELSYARRQEIEKRLDKPAMKQRIKAIAKKLFPKERKAELAKKTGSK